MTQDSINPDPSCEDDHDPNSLPVHIARQRIGAALPGPRGAERTNLHEALDRVLAEDVHAPFDVPPLANSARDGYALHSADVPAGAPTASLRLVGASLAGHPYGGAVGPGEAVRIFTGAVMPAGADSVAMQEHVEAHGDTVRVPSGAARAAHVRQAGEDLRRGALVLRAGTPLGPAELGVLASVGRVEVSVWRRPRVAFFSTGDELRGIGETLGPGDIHDSNRYTLHAMLRRLNVQGIDLGVVRDTPQAVRRAFEDATACADVIISSGGVSVGDADHVTATLAELGAVTFWKIAMKPGRPLAFGRVGEALFFGLPGNPVSVMVTFYQFVQPALRRMLGQAETEPLTLRLPLAAAITNKQPGRLEFQRGIMAPGADGTLTVRAAGAQGSHLLHGMSQANCFIVLPLESAGVTAGELVEVQPFEGLM